MFFAISGFLVIQSLERRDLASYAAARALRILPGLAASAVAVALVVGLVTTELPIWSFLTDPGVWSFVLRILRADGHAELPGVFAPNPVHEVMLTVWTLKYEMACYVLLMAIGIGTSRVRPLATLVLLVGSMSGLAVALDLGLPGPIESLCRFVSCFMIGVALWLFRARVPLDGRLVAVFAAVAVLFGRAEGNSLLVLAFECYAVVWLALRSLFSSHLESASDLSLGIYLYGFPIEQAVLALTGVRDPWLLLLIATPPTLLAATLSWKLVERPALAFKGRRASFPASRSVPTPN
jgi:peptidoglycan/LPS O-acetylase OafA/YrhL